MASPEKVKGPAFYFPSIEKTYGQPVEHWFKVLRAAGANALVAWHLAQSRTD